MYGKLTGGGAHLQMYGKLVEAALPLPKRIGESYAEFD
jgi:hypothetical protein